MGIGKHHLILLGKRLACRNCAKIKGDYLCIRGPRRTVSLVQRTLSKYARVKGFKCSNNIEPFSTSSNASPTKSYAG
jgi:hypothetical protein